MDKRHAALVAAIMLLSSCDSGTSDSGRTPDVPGPAAGSRQATADEAAASQRELDALKPSMRDADVALRSMPAAERRATIVQLKCLARQAVERGMRPRPRTAELVAEARGLAARSPDGTCVANPVHRGAMLPASSKSGVKASVSKDPVQASMPADGKEGEKE